MGEVHESFSLFYIQIHGEVRISLIVADVSLK